MGIIYGKRVRGKNLSVSVDWLRNALVLVRTEGSHPSDLCLQGLIINISRQLLDRYLLVAFAYFYGFIDFLPDIAVDFLKINMKAALKKSSAIDSNYFMN